MTFYPSDTIDLPTAPPKNDALLASSNGWLKQAFQKGKQAGLRRELSDSLLDHRLSVSVGGGSCSSPRQYRCSVVDLGDDTAVDVAARLVASAMAVCEPSKVHLELSLIQAMMPASDRFAVLVTNDQFRFSDASGSDLFPGIGIASRSTKATSSPLDPADAEYTFQIDAIESGAKHTLSMLTKLLSFQMFEDLRQMRRSGKVQRLRLRISLPRKHQGNQSVIGTFLNQVQRFETEAKMLKAAIVIDDIIFASHD